MFARITGAIIALFGLFTGAAHFGVLSHDYFGLDFVMIGVIVFIAHEVFALIHNMAAEGNKTVSMGVPALFILIAVSYFAKGFLPEVYTVNVNLIIAVLMIAEGLYRLH